MATRPVVADLVKHVGLPALAGGDDTTTWDDALGAALEYLEDRVNIPAPWPEDLTAYPYRLREGVLLTAAKLYKRRTSPEGAAGFGDLGVIRILGSDPDVERLIERLLRLDGFA